MQVVIVDVGWPVGVGIGVIIALGKILPYLFVVP